MKFVYFFIIISFFISSCKSKETTSKPSSSMEQKKPNQTILQSITINEMVDMKNTGDPYSVKNAIISGDTLILNLSYGGGCEEHQMELLFNNAYPESQNSDEQETLNPIQLTLKHNANNDRCRSIVHSEIKYNLIPIQDRATQILRIQLSGWETELIYTYTKQKH